MISFILPYSQMAALIVLPPLGNMTVPFRRDWVEHHARQQPLSQHAPCVPYGKMAARTLVQYVVLRGDLRCEPLSWPLGALVAQACHAALAVTHAYYDHPDTGTYLAQGGSMRTVVLEVRPGPGTEKDGRQRHIRMPPFDGRGLLR